MEHQKAKGFVVHTGKRFIQHLVVLLQSPEASHPTEGEFKGPTSC